MIISRRKVKLNDLLKIKIILPSKPSRPGGLVFRLDIPEIPLLGAHSQGSWGLLSSYRRNKNGVPVFLYKKWMYFILLTIVSIKKEIMVYWTPNPWIGG